MNPANLDPAKLREIENQPLRHYDERCRQFWEGTRDHDVNQNREALLRHIQGASPSCILNYHLDGVLVSGAGFERLEYYYRPAGKPRHQQPWLATV